MDGNKPLAYKLRPTTLDEFVGQEKVVGKGKLLYRMIKTDKISSKCSNTHVGGYING